MNLFDDTRIEVSFDKLIKTDFCQKKAATKRSEDEEFNPFSTSPQQIGHGQVLTSTVMHAITMDKLVKFLTQRKNKD